MPYDVDNPPSKIRGLSQEKQRQWVHVFNSCYEKHGDDAKCSKMAWGVTGGWKDKELVLEIIEKALGIKIDNLLT